MKTSKITWYYKFEVETIKKDYKRIETEKLTIDLTYGKVEVDFP